MVAFPNGKFKDQVDAPSGAFNRLISGPVYNLCGAALLTEIKIGKGVPMPIFCEWSDY